MLSKLFLRTLTLRRVFAPFLPCFFAFILNSICLWVRGPTVSETGFTKRVSTTKRRTILQVGGNTKESPPNLSKKNNIDLPLVFCDLSVLRRPFNRNNRNYKKYYKN